MERWGRNKKKPERDFFQSEERQKKPGGRKNVNGKSMKNDGNSSHHRLNRGEVKPLAEVTKGR